MRATPILQKALRRLPLSTKQASKGYYKGNRTGAMGRHTKYGGYILDAAKMRTYVAPDLSNFELSPFVDRTIKIPREDFGDYKDGATDGLAFIDAWKANGGELFVQPSAQEGKMPQIDNMKLIEELNKEVHETK